MIMCHTPPPQGVPAAQCHGWRPEVLLGGVAGTTGGASLPDQQTAPASEATRPPCLSKEKEPVEGARLFTTAATVTPALPAVRWVIRTSVGTWGLVAG